MEAQATRAEYKKLLEDKETEQDQRCVAMYLNEYCAKIWIPERVF